MNSSASAPQDQEDGPAEKPILEEFDAAPATSGQANQRETSTPSQNNVGEGNESHAKADGNNKAQGGAAPPSKTTPDDAATAAAEMLLQVEREIKKSLTKQSNSGGGRDDDKIPDEEDDDDPDDEDDPAPRAAGKSDKNLLVDHNYTDYAIISDKDLRLLDENSKSLPPPKNDAEKEAREKLKGMSCTYGPMRKSAGGVVQPFPGKLMEVLDRSDLLDIICWMPHGRAFIVKKPKLFAVDVLPRFFKQTKYLSFTRQLNLWGFKRITKGLDGGAYYHELFLRGRPYLAMRMKRHKVKGTGIKLTPNPKDEPLFYKDYPYMEQLNESRAIKPLPPLPLDRVGVPAQEASQGTGTSGVGGEGLAVGLAHNSQHQQLQQMGQYQFPNATPNMMGNPYLTSSQAGALLGDVPSFLHNRPPNFSENYASFSHHMSGIHPRSNPLSSSPMMGGTVGGNPVSYHHQTRNYENVLFAPGVSWGSVPNPSRVNDPIQDELSAMIRHRQATATEGGMFPSQNLTSDRLLMESLRDMDRAAQLKREQQEISMFGRGGPSPSASAFSAPMRSNNFAFSGPSISNGLGNGPFDRYRQIGPQTGAFGGYQGFGFGPTGPSTSTAATGGALTSTVTETGTGQDSDNLENEHNVVESSVKEALREANHLEKLALAQRAKARNIALAGALKLKLSSRMGGSTPSVPPKDDGQGGNDGEGMLKDGTSAPQFSQEGMQYAV